MSPEPGSIGELGEFGLIARIVADSPAAPAGVIVGPGDDTAVVAAPDGTVAVTVDMMVEGRHFKRDWSTPVDVGRRAAAASLADLVAMGARPTALVVGFAAPADLPAAWALGCTAGLREEAAALGAAIVGGDVVESPVITISVTALGDLGGRAPVLRSGARPGDRIAVAGRLGWAAAGLMLLSRGFRSPRALVEAHRFPLPPYAEGLAAAQGGATSMIDVSDGLIADALHVAQASGVRMCLSTADWEIPEPMQAAAAAYHVEPTEWMLTGGDDHALLATFPADVPLPAGFRAIGVVESADGREPGVDVDEVARDASGGFRHFA